MNKKRYTLNWSREARKESETMFNALENICIALSLKTFKNYKYNRIMRRPEFL